MVAAHSGNPTIRIAKTQATYLGRFSRNRGFAGDADSLALRFRDLRCSQPRKSVFNEHPPIFKHEGLNHDAGRPPCRKLHVFCETRRRHDNSSLTSKSCPPLPLDHLFFAGLHRLQGQTQGRQPSCHPNARLAAGAGVWRVLSGEGRGNFSQHGVPIEIHNATGDTPMWKLVDKGTVDFATTSADLLVEAARPGRMSWQSSRSIRLRRRGSWFIGARGFKISTMSSTHIPAHSATESNSWLKFLLKKYPNPTVTITGDTIGVGVVLAKSRTIPSNVSLPASRSINARGATPRRFWWPMPGSIRM